jgi:hypothetical protein
VELDRVIRPAAVLAPRTAALIVVELARQDVGNAGVWNATSTLWQRYDRPWDGPGGTRGSSVLVGSIAVMYDAPHRHEITIYRVTVSEAGAAGGWSVESLCDDALAWAGLTLDSCPRASLSAPPTRDPFHVARV